MNEITIQGPYANVEGVAHGHGSSYYWSTDTDKSTVHSFLIMIIFCTMYLHGSFEHRPIDIFLSNLLKLNILIHWPISGSFSVLPLPFSKHLQSLSFCISRPVALNVLHFHCCQLQTCGETSLPLRKTLCQLDQVGVSTGDVKEVSGELGQLLIKAKNGNKTRYTSFSHWWVLYKTLWEW